MARPLRLEFAGALYHITSRGNRQETIYLDDKDRASFFSVLDDVTHRFNWRIYAYCLMDNHYHLLVETPDGNLSRGMRQLNGVYTQRVNRRHGRTGHVFQGRYKSILVQKDNYLLELSRYIVLNPVRAGMVAEAGDWPWSSYRATAGEARAQRWLETGWLLSQFGAKRTRMLAAYVQFVREGIDCSSPLEGVQNQSFLGDDSFLLKLREIKNMQSLDEIPKAQRRPVQKSLEQFRQAFPQRDAAMARAYLSGAYTMKEIGSFFGVHYMTVSRAVRKQSNLSDGE